MMKWTNKTANDATLGDLIMYSVVSVAVTYGSVFGVWAAIEHREEIAEKAKSVVKAIHGKIRR